jgi:hypothetical protein
MPLLVGHCLSRSDEHSPTGSDIHMKADPPAAQSYAKQQEAMQLKYVRTEVWVRSVAKRMERMPRRMGARAFSFRWLSGPALRSVCQTAAAPIVLICGWLVLALQLVVVVVVSWLSR